VAGYFGFYAAGVEVVAVSLPAELVTGAAFFAATAVLYGANKLRPPGGEPTPMQRLRGLTKPTGGGAHADTLLGQLHLERDRTSRLISCVQRKYSRGELEEKLYNIISKEYHKSLIDVELRIKRLEEFGPILNGGVYFE